jgi:hypothetical protein
MKGEHIMQCSMRDKNARSQINGGKRGVLCLLSLNQGFGIVVAWITAFHLSLFSFLCDDRRKKSSDKRAFRINWQW